MRTVQVHPDFLSGMKDRIARLEEDLDKKERTIRIQTRRILIKDESIIESGIIHRKLIAERVKLIEVLKAARVAIYFAEQAFGSPVFATKDTRFLIQKVEACSDI